MIHTYDHEDAELLVPSAGRVVPVVAELIGRARAASVPVIYANDNFGLWRSHHGQLVEAAPARPHADLIEPIKPDEDSLFVVKARHSIYYETPMSYLMWQLGVGKVVLWRPGHRAVRPLLGPGRPHPASGGHGAEGRRGGFTTYDDQRQDRQLRGWVEEEGIPRVKIKIGESWGRCEARDRRRVARARASIGEAAELYVDANGGYGAKQALRMAAAYDDEGVTWFEEPVSSDRLGSLAAIRSRIMADVTAGEYGYTLPYFRSMLAADAVDCLQADVTRCGGITVWLRVAAPALSHGLEISGHCAPHAHAHAAASVPNVRHLEWFHDHVRIERLLFDGALDPHGGALRPGHDAAPGLGLSINAERARPFRTG
ncbi:isochorismatase family protein [Streptomyces gibsoniae]|uniref:Isochorismatase family protein n=1 Tax=Streptomyces gibsoniae TaxID=3075529 RepID=A0ABU2TXJ4_9ACTN|nr:isochorismatase family protein [Streptomyces sp. DSM 41699]MDT0465677.1 isochorismatase family protein [Streptomyces sp. DSM 41699]